MTKKHFEDMITLMIGITGVAKSGKDTLYKLLERKIKEKGLSCKRFALADSLKDDIKEFIFSKFSISLDDLKPKDKELIRPILVAYGKIKRDLTEGRYWISFLENKIEKDEDLFLPIITDIRYAEFDHDEADWILNQNSGILVHVSRIENGKIIPPANLEEEKNDLILSNKSHYKLVWCSESDLDSLYSEYNKNLEEIYELYERHRLNK